MLFHEVPSKPYCDICASEIDNIDILEMWVPEQNILACSECYGDPDIRKISMNTLFDLMKALGKHHGYMKSLGDLQKYIEEQQFSIEIDVLTKVEDEILRQPNGEKINFSTEELMFVVRRLRLQMAGHTSLARTVALISERGLSMTIRKDDM